MTPDANEIAESALESASLLELLKEVAEGQLSWNHELAGYQLHVILEGVRNRLKEAQEVL